MHDMLTLAQRWYGAYGNLPGKRVRITTKAQPEIPEVFWLLAQENEYLVLAQEPLRNSETRRRMTVMNVGHVAECQVLHVPTDEAIAAGFPAGATVLDDELRQTAVFSPGRVSVHALTSSGSQAWFEITGVEPRCGGYFLGPNHVLVFALTHLHLDMRDQGLVGVDELPLHKRPWDVPVRSAAPQLPTDTLPVATLTILVHETWSDQLGAGTYTPVHRHDAIGPKLRPRQRFMAWGYEALCQEAVRRRLLPSDFEPRIRRSALDL